MNKNPSRQQEGFSGSTRHFSNQDWEDYSLHGVTDPWLRDILRGKHAPQTATPEEAGAAAKATLAAMRRAKRPVRPRRPRIMPTAKLNQHLPARPLTAPEKTALRQKFWAPGGYDPQTAADVVDKLLS